MVNVRLGALAIGVACAACGRVNFDPRTDGGGSGMLDDVSGPQPSALLFYFALVVDPNVGGGADDWSGNGRLAPCLNPNPCPLLWDLDDTRGASRICDFEDGTLRVQHDAALGAIASGFTIAAWAKVENGGGCLVAMPGSWKLCANGTSTVTFSVGTTMSTANLASEWNHIAAVWNGTSAIIYVNGGRGGTAGAILTAPTMGAVIGASDVAGSAERVDGWMDEIRLYGVALSDGEIATLANE